MSYDEIITTLDYSRFTKQFLGLRCRVPVYITHTSSVTPDQGSNRFANLLRWGSVGVSNLNIYKVGTLCRGKVLLFPLNSLNLTDQFFDTKC